MYMVAEKFFCLAIWSSLTSFEVLCPQKAYANLWGFYSVENEKNVNTSACNRIEAINFQGNQFSLNKATKQYNLS